MCWDSRSRIVTQFDCQPIVWPLRHARRAGQGAVDGGTVVVTLNFDPGAGPGHYCEFELRDGQRQSQDSRQIFAQPGHFVDGGIKFLGSVGMTYGGAQALCRGRVHDTGKTLDLPLVGVEHDGLGRFKL